MGKTIDLIGARQGQRFTATVHGKKVSGVVFIEEGGYISLETNQNNDDFNDNTGAIFRHSKYVSDGTSAQLKNRGVTNLKLQNRRVKLPKSVNDAIVLSDNFAAFFHIKGFVTVGCQEIPREIVAKILKAIRK